MKEKQEYMKFLLPLVAVVVILESVVLISRMEEKPIGQVVQPEGAPTQAEMIPEEPRIGLSFAAQATSVKVGDEVVVEVNAVGLESSVMDAVDIYVKYDDSQVMIGESLVFGEGLGKPVFAKVSDKKQMIVANFLVMKEGGFELAQGKVVSLLKFELTPLTAGELELEFATGNEAEDSATMFVEAGTGRQVLFSASRLKIIVEE